MTATFKSSIVSSAVVAMKEMKVSKIIELLDAEVLYSADGGENREVKSAFASDMMSDVLAFVVDEGILITGLINPQVVRTAEMMDIATIVFCRGKRPDQTVIDLAKVYSITLLYTKSMMYRACGILYNSGLKTGESTDEQ